MSWPLSPKTRRRTITIAGLVLFVAAVVTALPRLESPQSGAARSIGVPAASAGSPSPPGCEYWVAPTGSDKSPGTVSRPWATLEHAVASVPDHRCTVWFKDGIYPRAEDLDRRFLTPTAFRAVNPYGAVFQGSSAVLKVNGGSNMTFEGFQFQHSGPGASGVVVYVDRSDRGRAEHITFRNNIFHDSYDDDLLKLYDGARFLLVENNVFYNQGDHEEHIDVNSVTDIVIQDNLFFNDFKRSRRTNKNRTKHYITVKDSNENSDGLEGSQRVAIRRNIFMNWQGGLESFLNTGNDGKPYHEAKDVRVENNLMIGNALNEIDAPFTVSGAKNVTFINNTVAGDLPSRSFSFHVYTKGSNPMNENILFSNNLWSDPTGTMGAYLKGNRAKFSDGDPGDTIDLTLDNNLYWNGGSAIPRGELVSPLVADARRVVADPRLNRDHRSLVVPYWTGSGFASGNHSIREEFVRLVNAYGRIPADSPAVGRSKPSRSPAEDILGRPRDTTPDLGAFEASP